ncbi:unnamed protein product [Vicia faba]|uniref:Uncharacterized protein n=1 Tax=Vicia faba TaxID=3906 RepID=A0AAV0YYX8_VICFA|nr:unnamed protein product [Vicia faba]
MLRNLLGTMKGHVDYLYVVLFILIGHSSVSAIVVLLFLLSLPPVRCRRADFTRVMFMVVVFYLLQRNKRPQRLDRKSFHQPYFERRDRKSFPQAYFDIAVPVTAAPNLLRSIAYQLHVVAHRTTTTRGSRSRPLRAPTTDLKQPTAPLRSTPFHRRRISGRVPNSSSHLLPALEDNGTSFRCAYFDHVLLGSSPSSWK